MARPVEASVPVTVGAREPRVRAASFSHTAHASRACTECHTTPVTLAPVASVAGCQDCHESHHAAGPACNTCHAGSDIKQAHVRPVDAHQACDECHAPATVARLVPVRQLCLTCHQPQANHYPARECVTCHFQSSPAEYQRHLLKGGRA